MNVASVGSKNNYLKQAFETYRYNCLNHSALLPELRDNFYGLEDLYLKNNKIQSFYDKMQNLSDLVKCRGDNDLYSVLLNELSKVCVKFKVNGTPEKIIEKAINNCKKNGDGFHELARIIDLENLYTLEKKRSKVYKALSMKKKCCKHILENYDENLNNYRSFIKPPTSKYNVEAILAHTYSQFGDLLAKTRPQDAIRQYEKSYAINVKLKRYSAASYAKYCIRDIRNGRTYNKAFYV